MSFVKHRSNNHSLMDLKMALLIYNLHTIKLFHESI